MFYACQTFKPFLEAEVRRLQEYEEARGRLLRILELEGQCVAVFDFGAVALPLELEEQLRERAGEEIAIIRLDGQYRMRGASDGLRL